MAIQVEIRDGNPWWLSPDIWVVPGDDPDGAPNSPIAGRNNYVWGRVRNTGSTPMTGGRVDFFWANPAAAVLRSTAIPIGAAYVDLAPGETKEVLCISPWVPVIVNDGHECLVAQAIHSGDPLPTPLPDPFDPPAYRQVAQRNLSVLPVGTPLMQFLIQLSAPARGVSGKISLHLLAEPRTLGEDMLASIGLAGVKPADRAPVEVGFVEKASCEAQPTRPRLDLDIPPGHSRAAYLQITSKQAFQGYHLAHVEERAGERSIGGITLVLLGGERPRAGAAGKGR